MRTAFYDGDADGLASLLALLVWPVAVLATSTALPQCTDTVFELVSTASGHDATDDMDDELPIVAALFTMLLIMDVGNVDIDEKLLHMERLL